MFQKFAKPTIVEIKASYFEAFLFAIPGLFCFLFTIDWLRKHHQFNGLSFTLESIQLVIPLLLLLLSILITSYLKIKQVALISSANAINQLRINERKIQLISHNGSILYGDLKACRINGWFALYCYRQYHFAYNGIPIVNKIIQPTANKKQEYKKRYFLLFLPKISRQSRKALMRHYYDWRYNQ